MEAKISLKLMTPIGAKMTECPISRTCSKGCKSQIFWQLHPECKSDFSAFRAFLLVRRHFWDAATKRTQSAFVLLSIQDEPELEHESSNCRLHQKRLKLLRRPLKGLADSCDTYGENLGFGENTAIAVEVCEDHFLSQPFTSWLTVSCQPGICVLDLV